MRATWARASVVWRTNVWVHQWWAALPLRLLLNRYRSAGRSAVGPALVPHANGPKTCIALTVVLAKLSGRLWLLLEGLDHVLSYNGPRFPRMSKIPETCSVQPGSTSATTDLRSGVEVPYKRP